MGCASSIQSDADYATTCVEKGVISRQRHDYAAALSLFEEALRIRRGIRREADGLAEYDEPYVSVLVMIGEVYLWMERLDLSLGYFLRAADFLDSKMDRPAIRYSTAIYQYVNMTVGMVFVYHTAHKFQDKRVLAKLQGRDPLTLAEGQLQRTVRVVQRLEGPRSETLVSLFHMTTRVLMAQRRHIEALRVMQRCMGLTLQVAQVKPIVGFLALTANILQKVKRFAKKEKAIIVIQQAWREYRQLKLERDDELFGAPPPLDENQAEAEDGTGGVTFPPVANAYPDAAVPSPTSPVRVNPLGRPAPPVLPGDAFSRTAVPTVPPVRGAGLLRGPQGGGTSGLDRETDPYGGSTSQLRQSLFDDSTTSATGTAALPPPPIAVAAVPVELHPVGSGVHLSHDRETSVSAATTNGAVSPPPADRTAAASPSTSLAQGGSGAYPPPLGFSRHQSGRESGRDATGATTDDTTTSSRPGTIGAHGSMESMQPTGSSQFGGGQQAGGALPQLGNHTSSFGPLQQLSRERQQELQDRLDHQRASLVQDLSSSHFAARDAGASAGAGAWSSGSSQHSPRVPPRGTSRRGKGSNKPSAGMQVVSGLIPSSAPAVDESPTPPDSARGSHHSSIADMRRGSTGTPLTEQGGGTGSSAGPPHAPSGIGSAHSSTRGRPSLRSSPRPQGHGQHGSQGHGSQGSTQRLPQLMSAQPAGLDSSITGAGNLASSGHASSNAPSSARAQETGNHPLLSPRDESMCRVPSQNITPQSSVAHTPAHREGTATHDPADDGRSGHDECSNGQPHSGRSHRPLDDTSSDEPAFAASMSAAQALGAMGSMTVPPVSSSSSSRPASVQRATRPMIISGDAPPPSDGSNNGRGSHTLGSPAASVTGSRRGLAAMAGAPMPPPAHAVGGSHGSHYGGWSHHRRASGTGIALPTAASSDHGTAMETATINTGRSSHPGSRDSHLDSPSSGQHHEPGVRVASATPPVPREGDLEAERPPLSPQRVRTHLASLASAGSGPVDMVRIREIDVPSETTPRGQSTASNQAQVGGSQPALSTQHSLVYDTSLSHFNASLSGQGSPAGQPGSARRGTTSQGPRVVAKRTTGVSHASPPTSSGLMSTSASPPGSGNNGSVPLPPHFPQSLENAQGPAASAPAFAPPRTAPGTGREVSSLGNVAESVSVSVSRRGGGPGIPRHQTGDADSALGSGRSGSGSGSGSASAALTQGHRAGSGTFDPAPSTVIPGAGASEGTRRTGSSATFGRGFSDSLNGAEPSRRPQPSAGESRKTPLGGGVPNGGRDDRTFMAQMEVELAKSNGGGGARPAVDGGKEPEDPHMRFSMMAHAARTVMEWEDDTVPPTTNGQQIPART